MHLDHEIDELLREVVRFHPVPIRIYANRDIVAEAAEQRGLVDLVSDEDFICEFIEVSLANHLRPSKLGRAAILRRWFGAVIPALRTLTWQFHNG